MKLNSLDKTIKSLPLSPGIYIFKDKAGEILYVGKAKNLRARVPSYFNNPANLSLAKQDMMRRIAALETKLTPTENDALILEAMQIKKHKPPYNVVFKDGKDYGFVKIDYREDYPTVTIVRRPKLGRGGRRQPKFFGPFTSAAILQENLRFLRRIFPYRKKAAAPTKFEADLLQKRSLGPVPPNRTEYLRMVKRLEKIIDGHVSSVKKELKKKMQALSGAKQYENAAQARDQIKWLDIFVNRQTIVSTKDYLEQSIPPAAPLNELQSALMLKKPPRRIEGYDISNIQGHWSVGAMVVFTNGEPDKKEYRKFKIKTVAGANDFASLAEVLKRRFKKTIDQEQLTSDHWKLPDLVLLDGGKGQLSVVLNALSNVKSQLSNVAFIALAKRAEEIFQGKELKPINLDPTSPASRLLQRIRDEAHRFGQAYYHSRHGKAHIKSRLDEIPGVGPKAKKLLMQKFGSLAGIKQADKNDIIQLIGKSKAEKLLENM
ncbi:MAG: excinuclease ABC subunit UvrC [Patescibacteria group bacterium]